MKVNAPVATLRPLVACLLLMLFATNAYAHAEVGVAGGLVSGFLHPIFGLDHLVAMVAVGLWGAQLGRPAIWVLPITFPVVMACGGLLGIVGMPLPLIEVGISVSAFVLGLMVAMALRPPLWVAGLLVAFFAIWHGHAHGTELPEAANPLAYAIGFVISTGLLHLCGIVLGILVQWQTGTWVVRFSGAGIAAVGMYFIGLNLFAAS